MIRMFFTLFASLLLMAASPAPSSPAPYAGLLAQHVMAGEKNGIASALVDYTGWSKDTRHAEAMKQLSDTPWESLGGNAEAAFWLNAYNLLVIDLIVTHPDTPSITHVGSVLDSPWKSFSWQLHGRNFTLSDIEVRALAAKPGDMRMHLALCNGALSAPDLANVPYSAEQLEAQLAMQAAAFVSNPSKGVKRWGTVLEVNRLFKPLMQEFEVRGGLTTFLQAQDATIPGNALVQGFSTYDWSLNGTWKKAEATSFAPEPEKVTMPEPVPPMPVPEKSKNEPEKSDQHG